MASYQWMDPASYSASAHHFDWTRTQVIARLKRLDRRQWQLLLSLIASFATRVPGLAGVLFFLPRLKAQIGLEAFATVMAAITLGGVATFVISGISYVTRRLVGEAFSRGDEEGEADALRGAFDVNIAAGLICSVAIVAYGLVRGSPAVFYIGALSSAFAVLIQQQDAVRAAYNEHYVTAMIQVVVQTSAYLVALLVLPASLLTALLGVAVIIGPSVISSLVSLRHLLRKRPYLLRGRAHGRLDIARESIMIGFGEGLLMASLGFIVLYLDFAGAVLESAWYATTLRIFTVVLVPVVLVLLPLSSYIRLIWNDCTPTRQQVIIFGTLIISLVYSLFVGAAMIFISRLYVGGALNIAEPGTILQTLTIFGMFTAVVVFKGYASVAFVVLDGKQVSQWSVVGTVVAGFCGAAATFWLSPMGAVSVFAAALTLAVVAVTFGDAWRFRRNVRSTFRLR